MKIDGCGGVDARGGLVEVQLEASRKRQVEHAAEGDPPNA